MFSISNKDKFAYIRNHFTANVQMLQAGISTHVELVKLQHNNFSQNVYSETIL